MKRLALVVLPILALFVPGAASAATYALVQGSGSSWAGNAINQWVADVASKNMKVVFTANGSAQGRNDYANQQTDFGVTDQPYRGVDPTTGATDDPKGRSYAYLPIIAGGTSLPYNLIVGGKRVTNLRLSGSTIAGIFTGRITNWNDPAITADNNGHAIGQSIPIIPVVRSDGAGVTNQFSLWMIHEYPDLWKACNGKLAATDYFPTNCGEASGPMRAQAGSDGVMNYVKSKGANGAIAMEEYSYPLAAGFPVARVLNKSGNYTLPTQYNVAVALTKAIINNDPSDPNYLTQKLDDVYVNPDPRTYPLSYYVYAIIPTSSSDNRMSTAKRQTLADFLYHSICQGQAEIGPIGYSPLPINLVQAGFTQIAKLQAADAGVTLADRNVSTCDNPTFDKANPSSNRLATIAPLPPACSKAGADPCSNNEDAYNANPTDSDTAESTTKKAAATTKGKTSKPTSAGGAATVSSGGSQPTAPAAPTTPVDGSAVPEADLGGATADPVADASDPITVVAATLPASPGGGSSGVLLGIVVFVFLGVLAVPGVVSALLARKRG